jgi:hypothetical protein
MVILPGEADYSLLKERIIDELCADNRSWRSQCPVGQKTDLPLLIYVVAGRWFDVSYSITFSARSRIGSGNSETGSLRYWNCDGRPDSVF